MPHMHIDTKVAIGGGDEGGRRGGRGRGDRGGRRNGGFGRDRGFGGDGERGFGGRDRDRDGGRFGRDRDRSRGGSHSRPNVHTATQRRGSASFFKKSSGATEY